MSTTNTILLPTAPSRARAAAWPVSGSILVVDLLVSVLLSVVLVSILVSVILLT
jgi:hypothetical protein